MSPSRSSSLASLFLSLLVLFCSSHTCTQLQSQLGFPSSPLNASAPGPLSKMLRPYGYNGYTYTLKINVPKYGPNSTEHQDEGMVFEASYVDYLNSKPLKCGPNSSPLPCPFCPQTCDNWHLPRHCLIDSCPFKFCQCNAGHVRGPRHDCIPISRCPTENDISSDAVLDGQEILMSQYLNGKQAED